MSAVPLSAVAVRPSSSEPPAVETSGLGKQFGARWALRDCTLAIPAGRICGLVGSNGAGKTTLLRMLVGLTTPTHGTAMVGGRPPSDRPDFLRDIGYLAQDIPLYRRWSVADHLALGRHLNDRWDDDAAAAHLDRVGIDRGQRAGTLSGGQRAQVGLALTIAKRPRVLLLDEPVAALDPLARREFLAALATAVADSEDSLTVVLSSHSVADLERICDYIVVLADGQPQLSDDLDHIMATHRLLTAGRRDIAAVERAHTVLRAEHTARQTSVWVRLDGPLHDPTWQSDDLGLEDILLAYLTPHSDAAGGAA